MNFARRRRRVGSGRVGSAIANKFMKKHFSICFFGQVFPMNGQKLYHKSMKYDGETIYKHEIDMLICFLMVPGSQNHNFDEFLKVYFEKKIRKTRIFSFFLTPCSKSLKRATNNAQN